MASNQQTSAQRADQIIQANATTAKPLDAVARMLTKVTGLEHLNGAIYNRAGYLLDRFTPKNVKAGMMSDYGNGLEAVFTSEEMIATKLTSKSRYLPPSPTKA